MSAPKTFHGLRGVVSKADRYTLWQRAENLILDVIEGILLASHLSKPEKLPHLERVSAKLNVLRIFLRLTKDTKLLDLKKCLLLQEIVDEIGRMLGGWMKSVRENNNSPSPSSLRERVVEAARRNCRAAPRKTLSLRLSSQLLLTFTRPSLTLSSAWLPFGSAILPIPVREHRESRLTALRLIPSSPCISFESNSAFDAEYLR